MEGRERRAVAVATAGSALVSAVTLTAVSSVDSIDTIEPLGRLTAMAFLQT
jgi:hypothetical protein